MGKGNKMNHVNEFSPSIFFREKYSEGIAGKYEMLSDMRKFVRYIFKDDIDVCEKMMQDITTIAEDDIEMELRILNGFSMLATPTVYYHGIERQETIKEMEMSFPIRNMAMMIITKVLEDSAIKMRECRNTIQTLSEAVAAMEKEEES